MRSPLRQLLTIHLDLMALIESETMRIMEWNPRMNVKRRKDIVEQNYFSARINGSGQRNPCLGNVSC